MEALGEQIGSTGEIKIRPTGDADGVGVTLDLVLPDQLLVRGVRPAAQISLVEDEEGCRPRRPERPL